MPREPKAGTFNVRTTRVDPPTSYTWWVMVDQATAVPTRFSAWFELSEPLFVVSMDLVMEGIRPVVRRIEAVRGSVNERQILIPAEDGITTTNLRQILVDRLVRLAVEEVRQPIEQLPEESRAALIRGGAAPEFADRLTSNAFRVPGVTPPGQYQFSPPPAAHTERKSTRDRVAEAAQHYRQAVANGSHAPGKDVAIAMGFSTSQVSRYLKSARERGLLEPPRKPLGEMTAGEWQRINDGVEIRPLDPSTASIDPIDQ
jgi:hypothetical protein